MLAQAVALLGARALTRPPTPPPSALRALSRLRGTPATEGSAGQDVQQPAQPQPQALAPPLPPPVMPGQEGQERTHWLDRYMPGARLWLEEKNRWGPCCRGLLSCRCPAPVRHPMLPKLPTPPTCLPV